MEAKMVNISERTYTSFLANMIRQTQQPRIPRYTEEQITKRTGHGHTEGGKNTILDRWR